MIFKQSPFHLKYFFLIFIVLQSIISSTLYANRDKDFPPLPNPPKLVNDFAQMMTPAQRQNLEELLLRYEQASSTQIIIVTVKSLGSYEVEQYATELGHRWGVGQKSKDNGLVILASLQERKMNISVGYGLEGAVTDGIAGSIIRNEMRPEFKNSNYYLGFRKAADALIKATQGEYQADGKGGNKESKQKSPLIVILVIVGIVALLSTIGGGKRGGGGRGGGNYASRRGTDFLTGALLGSILSGGSSRGSFGSGGGGGFGGFGGGGFGGGGASGSW